jgi:hypothetical protein
VIALPALRKLHLENVSAELAPELFDMLSYSKTIKDLEINFPLKYESMDLLDSLFARNKVLERIKITKLKPFHFNFLSHLAGNTSLKELHFEIFKLNREREEDTYHAFPVQSNSVLEELTIKGSSYKEYFISNYYFSSIM